MEYTQEEKQAIEECEELIKKEYYGDMYFYGRRSIQIILNLLQKQQKEIEYKDNLIKEKDKLYIDTANANLEWQKKYKELKTEINKSKSLKTYILNMRNGKELLQKTIEDYNNLMGKIMKLQTVSEYTIGELIDLFARGYTLNNYIEGIDLSYDDYIPKEAIREKLKLYETLPNIEIFQSKEAIIRVLKELLGE